VSIFPLVEVMGTRSAGLTWPVEGLRFQPGQMIGTSNRAAEDEVRMRVEGPGLLLMVPRRFLGALIAGVLMR